MLDLFNDLKDGQPQQHATGDGFEPPYSVLETDALPTELSSYLTHQPDVTWVVPLFGATEVARVCPGATRKR